MKNKNEYNGLIIAIIVAIILIVVSYYYETVKNNKDKIEKANILMNLGSSCYKNVLLTNLKDTTLTYRKLDSLTNVEIKRIIKKVYEK
jgi:hypothetical protein